MDFAQTCALEIKDTPTLQKPKSQEKTLSTKVCEIS
jgi:hypothetical protein